MEEWDNLKYTHILDSERKKYTSVTINKCKVFDDIFTDCGVIQALGPEVKSIQKDVERVRATFDHIGTLF